MTDLERRLAEINGLTESDIYSDKEERRDAQILFTAIMTDTLIESEDM